jgi:glutaredoxin 3
LRGYKANTLRIDDGSAIQSTLGEMTGQTTVPNIFIAKKHIGGNSDLQAKKGDLNTLLKDAGAI